MKFRASIFLFLSIGIFLQTACEKPPVDPVPPPEPARNAMMPPQPVVEDTAYVSANFAGFFLWSTDDEEIGSGISKHFLINGKIQWLCVSKPDLAPQPVIAFPDLASTEVSQLWKGGYDFEVTYRTEAGSKKAMTHLVVVDDGIPNGSIVLSQQPWKLVDWSMFPDQHYWISTIEIENRPDLFCYRLGKKLKVEIHDPSNGAWIEVPAETNADYFDDIANLGFYSYQYKFLAIQCDQNQRPDSVMDRLVRQPAAIRLSY